MNFLNVPYAQKNEVKALGAKWHPTAEKWYVPDGLDASAFSRWMSRSQQAAAQKIAVPAPASVAPVSSAEKTYKHIRELARLLNQEICFLDTETTGLICKETPEVALVEFACISFRPDGTKKQYTTLINPGEIEIHWAATKVHGITKKQVAHLQTFEKAVPVLNYIAKNAIISGFNTRQYDVPVIEQNYARYGLGEFKPVAQLDVRDVWTAINRGSNKGKLAVVAEKYGVVPTGAHRAMADVITTIDILEKMIERHGMDRVLNVYVQSNTQKQEAPYEARKAAASPSQSPKIEAPVLRNTPMAEAGQYILDLVRKNGRVLPADYPVIAAAVNRTPQQVASKVSTLFESGVLSTEQVEDVAMQRLVSEHLDSAIATVGQERLKPIKEYLDEKLGGNIDYIQLKIAMKNYQDRVAESEAIEVTEGQEEESVCRP